MLGRHLMSLGKLVLGGAALLWTLSPEPVFARGGGGHGGGGHAGGFHGGGFHGGGFHGGGFHHGGFYGGGYGRGFYGGGYRGGYGRGFYGGYGRGFYGRGFGYYPFFGYGYPFIGGYGYGYPYYGYGYSYPYYGGGFRRFRRGYYGGYGGYYPYSGGYYYPLSYTTSSTYPVSTAPATDSRARVTVQVPSGANVSFDGVAMQQQGSVREFVSPPLEPGYNYHYNIQATWKENGQTVSHSRSVTVQANEHVQVDFTHSENTVSAQP